MSNPAATMIAPAAARPTSCAGWQLDTTPALLSCAHRALAEHARRERHPDGVEQARTQCDVIEASAP